MRSRRSAREWALRVLYAHELNEYPIREIIADLLEDAKKDQNYDFCKSLCERVADNKTAIDAQIVKSVQKWELNRIAVLDHVVLRIGIAEFLYFDDIPFKVTINEAIELAKRYSTDQSGRFVNGILDAVSGKLQKTLPKSKTEAAEIL